MDKTIQYRVEEMCSVFHNRGDHFNVTLGLNTLKFNILPALEAEQDVLKEKLAVHHSDFLNQRVFGVESAILLIKALIRELESDIEEIEVE